MQRYFIYLAYDGTRYHGWQIQPNGDSVQQQLMNALQTLLRREVIEVTGAGRTDAGVHAKLMVAHFDYDDAIDCMKLTDKLNRLLPPDISVFKVIPVDTEMHARFSAKSRRYEYYVTIAKSPFMRQYRYKLHKAPDFELMNHAAKLLLQVKDFTSFSKLHADVKTNICHVTRAEWKQILIRQAAPMQDRGQRKSAFKWKNMCSLSLTNWKKETSIYSMDRQEKRSLFLVDIQY